MKAAEKKDLINRLIMDERLTTGHLKVLLHLINNEKPIISSNVTEILKCKPQYTSKILKDLKKYNYIIVSGKISSTRILLYSLKLEEETEK